MPIDAEKIKRSFRTSSAFGVTVWATVQQGAKGWFAFYNVSKSSKKDDGTYDSSQNFFHGDILAVQYLLGQAFAWAESEIQKRREKKETGAVAVSEKPVFGDDDDIPF